MVRAVGLSAPPGSYRCGPGAPARSRFSDSAHYMGRVSPGGATAFMGTLGSGM